MSLNKHSSDLKYDKEIPLYRDSPQFNTSDNNSSSLVSSKRDSQYYMNLTKKEQSKKINYSRFSNINNVPSTHSKLKNVDLLDMIDKEDQLVPPKNWVHRRSIQVNPNQYEIDLDSQQKIYLKDLVGKKTMRASNPAIPTYKIATEDKRLSNINSNMKHQIKSTTKIHVSDESALKQVYRGSGFRSQAQNVNDGNLIDIAKYEMMDEEAEEDEYSQPHNEKRLANQEYQDCEQKLNIEGFRDFFQKLHTDEQNSDINHGSLKKSPSNFDIDSRINLTPIKRDLESYSYIKKKTGTYNSGQLKGVTNKNTPEGTQQLDFTEAYENFNNKRASDITSYSKNQPIDSIKRFDSQGVHPRDVFSKKITGRNSNLSDSFMKFGFDEKNEGNWKEFLGNIHQNDSNKDVEHRGSDVDIKNLQSAMKLHNQKTAGGNDLIQAFKRAQKIPDKHSSVRVIRKTICNDKNKEIKEVSKESLDQFLEDKHNLSNITDSSKTSNKKDAPGN